MVDVIAETFRQYWRVIVTVASIVFVGSAAMYRIQSDLGTQISSIHDDILELRTSVTGNLALIDEFRTRTEGNRYTASDGAQLKELILTRINRMQEDISDLNRRISSIPAR